METVSSTEPMGSPKARIYPAFERFAGVGHIQITTGSNFSPTASGPVVSDVHSGSAPRTRVEREFNEQEQAFQQIPPLLLEPYRGQFVVCHDGTVLDSDVDLYTLTNRFFARHGDMPVYITRIGGEVDEVIDTPFFD